MNEVPDSVPAVPTAPSQLGRQLAQARVDSGFSIVDVARQLKLSPRQVEAMEAGDYARLPGAVFVRGFIRNYARLVKVDSAVLQAVAESEMAPANSAEQELPNSVNIPFPTRRSVQWRKYAIAGGLAVAFLALYEFYGNSDVADVAVTPHSPELPLQEVVTAKKDAETGAMPEGPGAVATESATVQVALSMPDNAAALARTTESQHTPREHLLKLTFDRNSWVKVLDDNGRRIFSRLNSAGTEQEVSGLPPLSIVVGNAAGVRLIHNDQRVDLMPHVKVDVARLTLE